MGYCFFIGTFSKTQVYQFLKFLSLRWGVYLFTLVTQVNKLLPLTSVKANPLLHTSSCPAKNTPKFNSQSPQSNQTDTTKINQMTRKLVTFSPSKGIDMIESYVNASTVGRNIERLQSFYIEFVEDLKLSDNLCLFTVKQH